MKKIRNFLLLFVIMLGMSYARNIQMPIERNASAKSSNTMDLAQVQEVEVLVKNTGEPSYIYDEEWTIIDSLDYDEEKRIKLQVGVEYRAIPQWDYGCGSEESYFTPTAEDGQEWTIDVYSWGCDPGSWTESNYYYIKKVWKNDEGHLDQRPEEIKVDVVCEYDDYWNGGQEESFTVTLNEKNHWYDYLVISYESAGWSGSSCTVTEQEVPGYTAAYSDTSLESGGTFTITNTYKGPVEKEIKVVKKWIDDENKYHTRPNEVVVELKNKDAVVQTATLNEENHWEYTFKVPEKDDDGNVITYTVSEKNPSDIYEEEITDYTITNTLKEIEMIEIPVEKVWVDENNKKGIRPAEVTIQLLGDNEVIEEVTLSDNEVIEEVTLSEENEWKHTFTVPKTKEDRKTNITYTVQEAEEIEGYTSKVDGYTITNTLIQEGKVPNTRDSKLNTMILFFISTALLMIGYCLNKRLRHS